jgi:hypothetical protein
MKHRLLFSAALVAATCAVLVASAAAAKGRQLYQFRGEVVATGATSLQVQIEGGNHPALRALIGNSQVQTFTLGQGTEILVWQNGVPHVASVSDVAAGDWVQVNVRNSPNASIADIEATPAALVGDHGKQNSGPGKALFLYVGTVSGGQAGGHLSLHVTDGNRLALRSLLGASVDQTFSYGDDTIFLLWVGKVPTVIDPSQLKAGDRITVRIRSARDSSLAQIEATAAAHVGDHEPADPSLSS